VPELRAELSGRLDAGQLVTGFLETLTGHTGALQGISLPVGSAELSGVGEAAAQVDTSAIGTEVLRALGDLPGRLAALPAAADVLAPVMGALELVERAANPQLTGDLGSLITRLSGELDGSRDEGFLGILLRIGNALGDAPEGQELRRLLSELLRLAGVDLNPAALSAGEALPAVAGVVSTLGGLMSLESVLGEAEHLTGLMARQLRPARVGAELAALAGRLQVGSTPLAQFVGGLQVSDAGAVESARAAVASAAAQWQHLVRTLSEGMAFGEATLVHLDVDRVLAEADRAFQLLRAADLDPARRMAAAAADRLRPVLALDLAAAPTLSLDELLNALEARLDEVAGMIDGLDPATLVRPLTDGLEGIGDAVGSLTEVLQRISLEVRTAVDQIRSVIAGLPFEEIANAIRGVMAAVGRALEVVRSLVATIQDALETAAGAATTAITTAEQAVDEFKAQVDGLFGEARDFIETLHLDQVKSAVADKIRAFADILAQAQMQPYFDTAVDAIGAAADVVSAVPFGLLPDSMKADVDAAVRPIKETDPEAVATEIRSLLQIGPDGKFGLRDEVEEALSEIQRRYQELLTEVERFDPHAYVAQLDEKLAELAAKIQAISPALTLEPVQAAIAQVKGALAGFDPSAELAPVRQAFQEVLAAIDRYSPATLLQPIEQRLDEAKANLVATIQLEQWEPALDDLVAQGMAALEALDPARLEGQLQRAFAEVQGLIDLIPDVKLGGSIGGLIALLLSGTGLRIAGWSFDPVTDWMGGASGSEAVAGRASRIAAAVQVTRDAVRAVDLRGLLAQAGGEAEALRAAVAGLPASEARTRLEAALEGFRPDDQAGGLLANQDRYLALLEAAAVRAETLRRIGFSEVDTAAAGLRDLLAPLAPIGALLREVLAHLGIRDAEGGIRAILRGLLAAAPPSRLIGLLLPVVTALRGRIQALLDAIARPLKDGIAELRALLDAVDLTPLREAVDGVVQEAKSQILALSPDTLLQEPLAAFDALKAELAAFDPLGAILTVLDALKAAIQRILGKLQASAILASPLEIYDHLIGELRGLNLDGLLSPILDQLDALAGQVDSGLTETVGAFQRLQDALPSGGGGSSVSPSASVAVG